MNIQQRVEAIILAILHLARIEGRSNILRTVLIKLLYLLDVYVAEANAGRETLTGLEWKFYHYGPYSVMAAEVIDDLAKRGILCEELLGAEFQKNKEYKLYSIPEYFSPRNFAELGVVSGVKLRLAADMKRYDNLTSLLDYVYFNTTPMIDAKPGDILNFQNCRKLNIADFKTLQMKPLNKKKLAENKRKLRELIEQRKSQPPYLRKGCDYFGKKLAEEPLSVLLSQFSHLSGGKGSE